MPSASALLYDLLQPPVDRRHERVAGTAAFDASLSSANDRPVASTTTRWPPGVPRKYVSYAYFEAVLSDRRRWASSPVFERAYSSCVIAPTYPTVRRRPRRADSRESAASSEIDARQIVEHLRKPRDLATGRSDARRSARTVRRPATSAKSG